MPSHPTFQAGWRGRGSALPSSPREQHPLRAALGPSGNAEGTDPASASDETPPMNKFRTPSLPGSPVCSGQGELSGLLGPEGLFAGVSVTRIFLKASHLFRALLRQTH